jgi:hypothetical protein
MIKKRILFFIKTYNDLDHISPLIWRAIKDGTNPILIFINKYPFDSDYRVKFLKNEGKLEILCITDDRHIKYNSGSGGILFKIFRRIYFAKKGILENIHDSYLERYYKKLFFDCSKEIKFLKDNNITSCVFEHSTPSSNGMVTEKYFRASKAIGITTFSIPHGGNVYTSLDVNEDYVYLGRMGMLPRSTPRNEFDYYIHPDKIRRDSAVKWGYDHIKNQVWGSLRYYPEWQKINLKICPPVIIKKDPKTRKRIVFMDHQKNYCVFVDKIWELLDRIAKDDRVFLIIKQSTRSGKDYHTEYFKNKFLNSSNVEFVGNENNSPSLIQWSDCVINFGSSIGIEVLLQNKPLINPYYLHSNRTIFEKFNAALNASNEDDVIRYIDEIIDGTVTDIDQTNRERLLYEVVYGRKNYCNNLDYYYNQITSDYLNY